MIGTVSIDKIESSSFIGIYPEEQLHKQPIEFGFSFEYDWDEAVCADSIEKAVDYAALTEKLKGFVSQSNFNLLETLAFEIAKKISEFSPKVKSVKVRCKKVNVGSAAEICLSSKK